MVARLPAQTAKTTMSDLTAEVDSVALTHVRALYENTKPTL
jgi:hypothetical protein